MHPSPSSLDTQQLAECLRAAAGDERDRQVDFLRYLDPFDAREAWRELGYDSLWRYCLGELKLREGAAGRRIGAMRVLRDFPRLEAPLRDGRLSLTTVVTLRPVLTERTLDDLVARASGCTDEETRHIVASIQPRRAPMEGIRKLPIAMMAVRATGDVAANPTDGRVEPPGSPDSPEAPGRPTRPHPSDEAIAPPGEAPSEGSAPPLPAASRQARASVEPVSDVHWSLRVTIGPALRADLEVLKAMLGHKIPSGDLAEVLHEAVRCAIEKHGKRRGAVKPTRMRDAPRPATAPTGAGRAHIPAAVRREVWARDGGRCTFVGSNGRRCESRTRLEFDHIEAAARGGPPTAANTRLRCAPHNRLHAEETFGRAYMARFRKRFRSGKVQPGPIASERGSRPARGRTSLRSMRRRSRPPS